MILERTLLLILTCVSVHLERIQANQVHGIPGVDYPNYKVIQRTSFRCSEQLYNPGLYADLETKCQVFHFCHMHRQESFLCPTGTTFNQALQTCDYWYTSDCSLAPSFYGINGLEERKDDNVEYIGSSEKLRSSNDLFEKMVSLYDENVELLEPDVRDGNRNFEIESQGMFGGGEIDIESKVDNSERFRNGNSYAKSADYYSVGGSHGKHSQATNNLQNDRNPTKFHPYDNEPYFRDGPRNIEIESRGNFRGGDIDSESRAHNSERFRYGSSYASSEDSYSIKEKDDKHSQATNHLQNDRNPTTLVKSSTNIPKSDEYRYREGNDLVFHDGLLDPLNEKISINEPFNYYENYGFVETEYDGNTEYSNSESSVAKNDIQTFDEMSKSTPLLKRISETEGNVAKRRSRPKTIYVVQPALEIVTLPPVKPKRNRVSLRETYPDVSTSDKKVSSAQSSDIRHEVENKNKEPIAMIKTSDVSDNFGNLEDNFDENENLAIDFLEDNPLNDYQIKRNPVIDYLEERNPVIDYLEERNPLIDYQDEQNLVDYQGELNPLVDYNVERKPVIDYQVENEDFDVWFTEDYSFASGDADFLYTEDTNAFDVFSDSQQDLNKNSFKQGAIEMDSNMQEYPEIEKAGSKSQDTEKSNKYMSSQLTDSSDLKSNDAFHDPSADGFADEGWFLHEKFKTGDSPSNVINYFPKLIRLDESGTEDYRSIFPESDVEYSIENTPDTYGTKLDSYDTDYNYFQTEFDDADKGSTITVLPFRDTETYEHTDTSIKTKTFSKGEIDTKNIAHLYELSNISNWEEYQNSALGKVNTYLDSDRQEIPEETFYNTAEVGPSFAIEDPEILSRDSPQANKIHQNDNVGVQKESTRNYNIDQLLKTDEHLLEFAELSEEFNHGDDLSSSNTGMIFTGSEDQNVRSTETSIDQDFERIILNDSSSLQEILGKSSDAILFTDSEYEQITEHTTMTPTIKDFKPKTPYDLTNLDDFYKFGTTSQNLRNEVTVSGNFYSEEESTTFEGQSSYFEDVNFEEQQNSDESGKKYLETDNQMDSTNAFYYASEVGSSFVTVQPDIPEVSSRDTPPKVEVYDNDNLGKLKESVFDDAETHQLQKTEYTELFEESDRDFKQNTTLHPTETPVTIPDADVLSVGLNQQTFQHSKVTSAIEDFEQNTLGKEGFFKFDPISQKYQTGGTASTPFYAEKGNVHASEDATFKESSVKYSAAESNISEQKNGNLISNIKDSSLHNATQISLKGKEAGESVAKERVVRELFHRSISSSPPSKLKSQHLPTSYYNLEKSAYSDRTGRLVKFSEFSKLASFIKKLMAAKKAKLNILKKFLYTPNWEEILN